MIFANKLFKEVNSLLIFSFLMSLTSKQSAQRIEQGPMLSNAEHWGKNVKPSGGLCENRLTFPETGGGWPKGYLTHLSTLVRKSGKCLQGVRLYVVLDERVLMEDKKHILSHSVESDIPSLSKCELLKLTNIFFQLRRCSCYAEVKRMSFNIPM